MYQKRPDFLQAKEWFFSCFLRPCILGTFCRFIPCNLSRLSHMMMALSIPVVDTIHNWLDSPSGFHLKEYRDD